MRKGSHTTVGILIAIICAIFLISSITKIITMIWPLLMPVIASVSLILSIRTITRSHRQIRAYRYTRTSAFLELKAKFAPRVHDHLTLVAKLRNMEDSETGQLAFKSQDAADDLAQTWCARHPEQIADVLPPHTRLVQTTTECNRAAQSPVDTIVNKFCTTIDEREVDAINALITETDKNGHLARRLSEERHSLIADITDEAKRDVPQPCMPYVLAELGIPDNGPIRPRAHAFLLLSDNTSATYGKLIKADADMLAQVSTRIQERVSPETPTTIPRETTEKPATMRLTIRSRRPDYVHIDTRGDIDPERIVRVMKAYQSQKPVATYAAATITNLGQTRRIRDSVMARLDDEFKDSTITHQRYADPVRKVYQNILRTAAVTANRIQDFDPALHRELSRTDRNNMTAEVRKRSLRRLLDDLEDQVTHQDQCLLKLEHLNDELSKSVSESVEGEADLEEMDELTEQVRYYR